MKKPDARKKKRDFDKERWIEDRVRTVAQRYLNRRNRTNENHTVQKLRSGDRIH